MKIINFLFLGITVLLISCKTNKDVFVIDSIFDNALNDSTAYQNLEYLTNEIGGRLACSKQGLEASYWTKSIMEAMNLDTVFLQEASVKNWKRGSKESAYIKSHQNGTLDVEVCALGRGIGTNGQELKGNVIKVDSLEELKYLGREKIEGKIVFFNQVMNDKYKNTFRAYGEVADQRFYGPVEAAKYGAKGAVIRSLTTSIDEFPHTGVTSYADKHNTVPAVSICTRDANVLSDWLWEDPDLEFSFTTHCKNMPDTIAYNVIGEIKGSEFPNTIITVGGHLDSWDIDPGAHDDGSGCMQAIEVLRIFNALDIKPRHTIRAVMFMDEEISQGGAKAYLAEALEGNIEHLAAMESDRGATKPLGFTFKGKKEQIDTLIAFSRYFDPYDINEFKPGYGGVDINPLEQVGAVLIGYLPDPTYYFNWHHCANNTFDQIDFADFQKGSAAMASLIYLIDKYGL